MAKERSEQSNMSNKRSSNGEDDRDILDIGKDIEELVFEDPFGDEFEEEEVVDNNDDNDEHDMNAITEEDPEAIQKQVWRPGVDELQDGETLEYDPSAYVTYHSLKTEWPCLSFDIIKDNLGDGRHRVTPLFAIKTYIIFLYSSLYLL